MLETKIHNEQVTVVNPVNETGSDARPVFAGTGPCKSCSCQGFVEGRSEYVCECGHKYDRHRLTW